MRVGVVGLGAAARSLHLPALKTLAGVELVGGADLDPKNRNAWARAKGGSVYEDVGQLLERRPDIVVVCTPPASHAEMCLKALNAGAHVVCEKPFVANIEEATRVQAKAVDVGRTVAVNHEFRYMPVFARIPALLGSRDVGRPVFLQFTQLMDMAPWDEPTAWRAAMSDRTLFEAGVHMVDLVLMLVGPPTSVFAVTSSGRDPTRSADAIHILTMDFGDGLIGQISIDRLCRSATRYMDLRLDCEHVSIRASVGGRALLRIGLKRAENPGVRFEFGLGGLAWTERGTKRSVVARNPTRAPERATAAMWRDVIDSIERGVEPPSSARTATEALKVIEAAYLSARTNAVVVP